MLAALVSDLEPPTTPLEQALVTHVVARAAWSLLTTQVRNGFKSYEIAHHEFSDVLAILDSTPHSELAQALSESCGTRTPKRTAERIREYLDGRFAERITLDAVARSMGCPVRRITGEFRECYGMTVYTYLTHRRLAEAIRLLIHTDMKVWAVAISVGFQDKTALYRQFLRVFNTTPRSVRQRPQQAPRLIQQLRCASNVGLGMEQPNAAAPFGVSVSPS